METSVRHKHNMVPHMAMATVTILLTHCHNSTHIFSQPHRSPNPTQMLTYTKVHTQGHKRHKHKHNLLTTTMHPSKHDPKSRGACTVSSCHSHPVTQTLGPHTHTTDTSTSNHKHAERQRRIPSLCQLQRKHTHGHSHRASVPVCYKPK